MSKNKYNENDFIKFEMKTIKWSLCDYSDTYIFVTGDVTVNAGNNTDVAFNNCKSFVTCKTEIYDIFVDEADHIYITMPMYNLIEYSDNYCGSLKEIKC